MRTILLCALIALFLDFVILFCIAIFWEANHDSQEKIDDGKGLQVWVACVIKKFFGFSFFTDSLKWRYQYYLNVMKKHEENVRKPIEEYKKHFYDWEAYNFTQGRFFAGRHFNPEESRRLEAVAWESAVVAMAKFESEFMAVGWPHRLKKLDELFQGENGTLYDCSREYWDNLKEFLTKRIERLS